MQDILILGYGNMARAIAKGLTSQGVSIKVWGRNARKIDSFVSEFEGAMVYAGERVFAVILCTKGFDDIQLEAIKSQVCISAMAAVSMDELKKLMPECKLFVRVMPTVAASRSKSTNATFMQSANGTDGGEDWQLRSKTITLLSKFGEVILLKSEMELVLSISTSGSGLAFLALCVSGLIDGGVLVGLSRSDSKKLVKSALEGLCALLEEAGPQEIIDSITSPGGTTIEGISVLESMRVRGALMESARASVSKILG